jgi:hypothetical protein
LDFGVVAGVFVRRATWSRRRAVRAGRPAARMRHHTRVDASRSRLRMAKEGDRLANVILSAAKDLLPPPAASC